ncbi:helix-turn-helix domain-containing protein [Actinacidiphila glaucinigra]|uniref:helix-turn-helix domain-containing protein n=1 Tax=Actinacidiphila glaucinigra TaxID=235986 RepID=UPI0037C756F3
MLETVGLTAAEAEVYRLLLDAESASAEEVSGRTGLGPPAVGALLSALEAKGLAYAVEESPGAYAVIPPEVALVPRLQRHAEALEQDRAVVLGLVEAYRRSARSWGAGEAIEVISGAAALRQRLRQLQDGVRHEMLWFCKARHVAMPAGSNREEYDALGRGVLYRVLYEQAYFDDPGAVDNVVRGVRAGEVARAVPRLPLRMAVADRSLALLPLSSAGTPAGPRQLKTALVRESSLLEALIDLFQHYWEVAAPLRVTEEGQIGGAGPEDPAAPVAEDRHLLSLMVAGMTDEAIAGQLRVSKRTVQRRVQGLMNLAGVATRMQLGWHAARRNWL